MNNLPANKTTMNQAPTNMATTKKLILKKTILTTMVCAAITVNPLLANMAAADEYSTAKSTAKHQQQLHNENVGFGSGLIIGAIVAGPLGAIVAGIGGAFVAKHINAVEEVDELSLALVHEKTEHQQALALTSKRYNEKLQQSEQAYQRELLALEQGHRSSQQLKAENLLMSLQFSTGSSEIAPHYQEQVAALAEVLNQSPTMLIDLSGYTDLIGEESLNQALSVARVESVKRLLMAQGVSEQQIATHAYGEHAPVVANADKEVNFYDRRVVLKLHNTGNGVNSQTAKN